MGINENTHIAKQEDLNDLINLYCSSQIIFYSSRQKFLLQKDNIKFYKKFYVIYVPKSNGTIYFVRDGYGKNREHLTFRKYDVPIRNGALTGVADDEYIADLLEVCTDETIASELSTLLIRRGNMIPEFVNNKRIPGELPRPDYDVLIGREQELHEIINFLNNRKLFSWTIDGIGGSGKSSLALELAYNIRDGKYNYLTSNKEKIASFDGVVWITAKSCELHYDQGIVPKFDSAVTLEIMLDKILDTIDLEELKYDDIEDKKDKLVDLLEACYLLIIIDNLESIPESHQSEIIDFVEQEMPPPSKVIYTTRTKFHRGYSSRVMELEHDDAVLLAKCIALDHENFDLIQDNLIINRVVSRTGAVPLGIKWVVSRLCHGETIAHSFGELLDDTTLVKYCFEDTFKCLNENDELTLFSIAICDFPVSTDNIEFLTELPKSILRSSLKKLESLSLVEIREDKILMLPLTKDYANYQLAKKDVTSAKLKAKLEKVVHGQEFSFNDSVPSSQIIAMRLYKEAGYEESQGNIKIAADKLEQALSISNEDYILKGLAGLYERLEMADEAIKVYHNLIETYGDDYDVLKKLSKHHAINSEHESALHFIKRALEIRPGDKELWFHCGRREMSLAYKYGLHSSRGLELIKSAIASFKNSMRKNEEARSGNYYNSINCFNIARCFYHLGDYNSAYDACNEGLSYNFNNLKLRSFLKKVQAKLRY